MADNSALLANIFQAVTNTLVDNQHSLNQADDQNHDHGTNMVQTFQTITSSLEQKKASSGGDALAYAAQQVSKEATSGSGKLYAQNLANAANQFQGQNIDSKGALQLLQTLIGGGQTPQQPQQPAQPAGGDILGELLGGLTGAGNSQANPNSAAPTNSGLDMGDLLNAGMAFMQAKQSGGSNASSLIQAFVSGSGMGNSNHRTQSTQLVASSFLQALGSLTGKSQ